MFHAYTDKIDQVANKCKSSARCKCIRPSAGKGVLHAGGVAEELYDAA